MTTQTSMARTRMRAVYDRAGLFTEERPCSVITANDLRD